MKRALIFLGDLHCGSTVGLAHPQGVMHDDGAWIYPSKVQLYLWEKYQEFCRDAAELAEGRKTHLFLMGDLVDGDHHRTHQLVSNDQGLHVQIAVDVLMDGVMQIPHESVHALRGTPSHVGKAAGLEAAVMARLSREGCDTIVKDEEGRMVHPFVYADFEGTLIDARHHGRQGQREHTRGSYSKLYGLDVYLSHHLEGRRPPQISLRGHLHKAIDSGPDHRGITRTIQLPCFQLHTEWTRRISIETMPDIGGCVILLDDGKPTVEFLLYKPEPDSQRIWRPDD